MSKWKLTYFDIPASRGEECRLALHLAGIDFEDVRVPFGQWSAMKSSTPYGSLPFLELPGRPILAHSNAILGFVGREYGLHPTEHFEAAQHEAMMGHVEDLRAHVGPTLRIGDPDEKRKVREALATAYLPSWAEHAERQLNASSGEGPFFAGSKLHVVDLKLHMAVRWFIGGKVDHIPATVFAAYPKLNRVHDAVRDHAGVLAWYAKTST